VPTLAESGFAGFDLGTWFAVLAPAAVPKDVQARLASEMRRVIASPEFGRRMQEVGAEPIGDPPEALAQRIRADTEKFARLVKQANVVIE
jgi:tripartite-type tricarboxylate transporter receptor subunit TctC